MEKSRNNFGKEINSPKFIPVNEPLLNGNEKKYLEICIDSGWISSEGSFVKEFEGKFSQRVGRKFGIAVSSGTAALDTAVASIKLKKNDEVILPTFTIISCAAAIVRSGATPVLVDCDPLTFNMDIGQIGKKITKKTKAIMIVHIYGLPVDVDPVLDLAKKYNLMIIEDAAEMHGQRYKGKECGSFGDISIFSFYPNKIITTGEGGMVLTDNERLFEECKKIKNLYFDKERRYIHEDIGWNFRMSNIQAAIGLAQLEQIDRFILRKKRIGKLYTELLTGFDNLQLPLDKTNYSENIYWVYPIVLKERLGFDATEAMRRLLNKNVGTRHFFWPMHLQPAFKKMGLFKNERYPVSEKISKYGFYIPSGLAITDDQIKRVARIIKEELK
jgi:perosamine synthetase